jgi:hypothetical protein
VKLTFYPDSFTAYMANDNPWHHIEEARGEGSSMGKKIWDRLRKTDRDPSHAHVIGGTLAGGTKTPTSLTPEALSHFYRAMFALGEKVYGESAVASSV